MRFVGANRAPHVTGSTQLPGRTNYLLGNDPKHWLSGIPTYARVRYQDVYPGVDVVYYGTRGSLEYDLMIDRGADPSVITMDCQGATKVSIDAQGNLRLMIGGGEVLLRKPKIYQLTAGSSQGRKNIDGGYVLKAGGHIGLQVGEYNRNQPLIVDPVLSYSTYLGGSGYDAGTAIAIDSSGNAYVTGFTRSPNFPVTSGAYQTKCGTSGTCNGYFWDAFVTKLSANGQVVYSTFLGGSGNDMGKAIAVDDLGAAYVAGQTFSSDFPTTSGAFKRTYGGSGDAFVAKLNPDGTALQYSAYLGGSAIDNAGGIAVDVMGNAYVTGQTYSTNFPTASPIQALNGGNQDSDAFVTKINSAGSALVYSTYLGGASSDGGEAIAIDPAGNAYITGATKSPDFPLVNAIQASCRGCPGNADAFVAEIGPNGAALLRATYLGGSSTDHGSAIAVDASGSIYVTGFTYSADFPTTTGAYQTSLGPGGEAVFVSKISSDFSALVYSTYLHGNGLDFGKTIAVDTGNVYVGGQTYSTSFPVVNAIQTMCSSSGCFYGTGFLSEFNAAGSGLVFSTYLGGTYVDQISGTALDSSANPYVTGEAGSSNFPTANPVQTTFGGSYADAFAARISLAPAVSLTPTNLVFGNQPVGVTSGAQAVLLTSSGTAPLHIASIATTGEYAQTNDCGNGVAAGSACTIFVTFTPSGTGTRTGTLVITDNVNGSPQVATLTGTGGGPTIAVQPASQSVLLGHTATFTVSATGTAPLTYQWQKNNTNINLATSSTYTTPATTAADNGSTFDVVVTNSTGRVTSNSAILTVILPPSITTQPANQSVTAGQAATFMVIATGTAPLAYQWQRGTTNIQGATSSSYTTQPTLLSDSGSQFAVVVSNSAGTARSNAAILTVNPPLTAPTVNPVSVTFATVVVGATSPAQTVTLTNNGGTPLSITSILVTGLNAADFSQSNTCGTSVAAGGSCAINATFSPSGSGTRTASVSITDNASNSPQTITLSGIGADSACNKFVSPSGSDSNSGSVSSPWQHLQKAFNSSAAGDVVCLRGGTYPSQSGTTYSQIMNNSGASGNPITFENFPGEVAVVQGNTRVNGAFVTVKGTTKVPPYGLVFQIGTSGLAINGIDVLNTHDVNFDHIELSGFDNHAAYNQSNGCNNKVLASYIHDNGIGTGVSGISWGSTAAGCTNGGLVSNNVVEHNGSGIQLYSGGSTTIPANVTVEENTFVSSAGYGIVVWGDNNIVANNIAYGNGDALNDPQGTIHTGVANVVDHNVTFSPTSSSRSGWYLAGGCCLSNNLVRDPLFISTSTKNWHLTSSSPVVSFSNLNYVQPIDKDGVTRGPSFDAGAYQFVPVSLNPSSLTFASQIVGTTSTARQIALTNNGGAVLNINSISIAGLNASDFAQSNTCGAAVAAGGTCTINVTFAPSASGTRSAALSIADNANGSPQIVSLTGSGQ
jgi:parallel beta-helix repeat protein